MWTRTTDVLLLLSPLLALALTVALHMAVPRAARVETIAGFLLPGPGGTWLAQLEGRRGSSTSAPATGDVLGDFEVVTTTHLRGWPFAGAMVTEPPKVSSRTLQTSDAAEVRAAIERALRDADRPVLADALAAESGPAGGSRTTVRLGGMIGNLVVAWVALFLLLPLLVQVMRLVAWSVGEVRRVRRRRRIDQGRCPRCGFDVRGSVWSARCPECGGILG